MPCLARMKRRIYLTKADNLDPFLLEQAYPEVDPGIKALGYGLVIQLRSVAEMTDGGIILPDAQRQAEQFETQIGRVISIGKTAFCARTTGQPWPEGNWVEKGDFVRIPSYAKDNWYVELPETDAERLGIKRVMFTLVQDLNLIGKVTGDPLSKLH